MSASTEQSADALAERFLAVERELTKLEAAVKAYQKARAEDPDAGAIPPVTYAAIRGGVAGAAAAVASAHLLVTPYDVRPRPMDGGGK